MKVFRSPLPELSLKYKTTNQRKVKVSCSQDAFFVLSELYDVDTIEYQESAVVLFLNRANNTIGWMRISTGGISGTVIDGKILFAAALVSGASSIILSHNHPSGELKPSSTDIVLTKELTKAGKLLDISIIDHLILIKDNYLSMSDEGIINS